MRYAAYGSNLHPVRLGERIASARLLGTSFLPHWSLRFHKRSRDASGKGNIVSGSDGIYVAVFDVSRSDKAKLDAIEGVGAGYSTFSIEVPDFGECATYVADASHIDDSLVPYDWYRQLVLLGGELHGFPPSYLAGIESVAVRADPDEPRREKNMLTIHRMREARGIIRAR